MYRARNRRCEKCTVHRPISASREFDIAYTQKKLIQQGTALTVGGLESSVCRLTAKCNNILSKSIFEQFTT